VHVLFGALVLRGGVAQMVEQAAHIRFVRGSSPFAAIFSPMQLSIE
jgi:hypothetical protein